MASPITDFGRVLGAVFRFARTASYTLIGVMVFLLAMQVADIYRFFADIHWTAGVGFLVVFLAAVWWFIGRPMMAFLRMPPVLRPPKLPPLAEREE